MKPQLLLMAIVLGLTACAEASTASSPSTPATEVLQPAGELAALDFEVHAAPG